MICNEEDTDTRMRYINLHLTLTLYNIGSHLPFSFFHIFLATCAIDKADHSAFQSTLNSPFVSYGIV